MNAVITEEDAVLKRLGTPDVNHIHLTHDPVAKI